MVCHPGAAAAVAAVLVMLGGVVAATPAAAAVAGGQVYTWGGNSLGQLGRDGSGLTPGTVSLSLPPGTLVTDVAAGYGQVLALTSTGKVYAWGWNNDGQVGDGTTTNRDRPVLVSMPAGVTVTAIAAGWGESLALTSTGDVYSWGNPAGLGRSDTTTNATPGRVELPSGTTATAIGAGGNHGLVP